MWLRPRSLDSKKTQQAAQGGPRPAWPVLGGVCCGVALAVSEVLQQFGLARTSVGKAGFLTAMYILIVPLIGLLVGNVLIKEWVMRPRPFVTHADLIALVDPVDQWSFPSGHTLSSFAAATALCFFHRKSGLLACLVAALIGFSRLYACVHYPTDVLAGMLIGILCGLAAGWITDRVTDRIHTIRLRKGA